MTLLVRPAALAAPSGPVGRPSTVRILATALVWVLTLASVVSWRRGVLFDGGVDAFVLAKAVVAAVAAGAALLLWRTAPARRVLSAGPTVLVTTIVGLALLGALAAGAPGPDLVLSVRIALLAGTVLLVLAVTPTSEAVGTLLAAMVAIGLVAAVSGWLLNAPQLNDGRLSGAIPPLEPNELATLMLPGAIGAAAVVAQRGLRLLPAGVVVVLTGIIVLTGSRTALAMLALGIAVVLLRVRTLTPGTIAVLLLGAVAGYATIAFTGVLGDLVLRDEGIGRLLTLNSRTISWQAVFAQPKNGWAWWIGSGLAVKTIAVLGQAWTQQVFDSSWVSSIAQDGVVGTVLLALWAALTLIATLTRRDLDAAVPAIALTTVVRSFLENGMIESSVTFAVFLTLATVSWPGTAAVLTRTGHLIRSAPPHPAGRRSLTPDPSLGPQHAG